MGKSFGDPFLKERSLEVLEDKHEPKSFPSKPPYKPPQKSFPQKQFPPKDSKTQELQQAFKPKKEYQGELKVPNYFPLPVAPAQNVYYYHPGYTDLRKPFVTQYTINMPHNYYERGYPVVADYLPMKGAKHSFTTLGERLLLFQYVVDGLIRYKEGEVACLHPNKQGFNLLKHIRHIDPRPINLNLLSNNPYYKLSEKIRVYRTCYPIQLDKMDKVVCQPNSVGMHIRIYKADIKEYSLEHDANNTEKYQYNIWREIDFYKHVRSHYLRKKICPHFVLLYGYYKCPECQEKFKTEGGRYTETIKHKHMYYRILNRVEPKKTQLDYELSGNHLALIMLTEGPNYNILEWMSSKYKYKLDSKEMINRGVYRLEVWKNILFQICYTLAVLQNDGIYVNQFGYDNIWIKEVKPVGYWLYIVDGIKYYIPNTGYLVMIDMGYADGDDKTSKRIYSKSLFQDQESDITDEIKKSSSLDPNFFSQALDNVNIAKPPEEIIELFSNNKTKSPLEFIKSPSMAIFLHNRVGGYANLNEVKLINKEEGITIPEEQLRPGELVLAVESGNVGYTWVICKSNKPIGEQITCYSRKTSETAHEPIQEMKYHVNKLRKYYGEHEPEQNQSKDIYPPSCDLNTNPLETYIFDPK